MRAKDLIRSMKHKYADLLYLKALSVTCLSINTASTYELTVLKLCSSDGAANLLVLLIMSFVVSEVFNKLIPLWVVIARAV